MRGDKTERATIVAVGVMRVGGDACLAVAIEFKAASDWSPGCHLPLVGGKDAETELRRLCDVMGVETWPELVGARALLDIENEYSSVMRIGHPNLDRWFDVVESAPPMRSCLVCKHGGLRCIWPREDKVGCELVGHWRISADYGLTVREHRDRCEALAEGCEQFVADEKMCRLAATGQRPPTGAVR